MGREVVALNYDAVKFYVQLRECAHCNGSSKERYGLVTPPRSSGGIFATRYTRRGRVWSISGDVDASQWDPMFLMLNIVYIPTYLK